MATQTLAQQNTAASGLLASARGWLAKMVSGFDTWLENYGRKRGRMDEIEALEALSDEQLAGLGLTRDRIAQYVFRDIIAI